MTTPVGPMYNVFEQHVREAANAMGLAIFVVPIITEESVADGSAIAGSPKTVLAEIERQVAELGVNYLLTYLFLGNMTYREATRSLNLFSTEVMPKLAKL